MHMQAGCASPAAVTAACARLSACIRNADKQGCSLCRSENHTIFGQEFCTEYYYTFVLLLSVQHAPLAPKAILPFLVDGCLGFAVFAGAQARAELWRAQLASGALVVVCTRA